MSKESTTKLAEVVRKYERELLADWMEQQLNAVGHRRDIISATELQNQSREFLSLLHSALQNSDSSEVFTTMSLDLHDFLAEISRRRAKQGFSPSETAAFILSLKQPLFARLQHEYGKDIEGFASDVGYTTLLLDRLGLETTEAAQKTREEIISRQQQELLELSTPVVELWQHILALPLIGTLDSARTQVVMESLLQRIVETGSSIAIIDITGVPTVDTLVAQHLLKTVAAARLMGADCIISGIRPQIAQTIVLLGVDLTNVTTKASLADAFAVALQRTGMAIKPRVDAHQEPLPSNGTLRMEE